MPNAGFDRSNDFSPPPNEGFSMVGVVGVVEFSKGALDVRVPKEGVTVVCPPYSELPPKIVLDAVVVTGFEFPPKIEPVVVFFTSPNMLLLGTFDDPMFPKIFFAAVCPENGVVVFASFSAKSNPAEEPKAAVAPKMLAVGGVVFVAGLQIFKFYKSCALLNVNQMLKICKY